VIVFIVLESRRGQHHHGTHQHHWDASSFDRPPLAELGPSTLYRDCAKDRFGHWCMDRSMKDFGNKVTAQPF
jgi:hypothetical protein